MSEDVVLSLLLILWRLLVLSTLGKPLRLAVSESWRGGVAMVEGAGHTSVGRVWMTPRDLECMKDRGDRGARVGR